MFDIASLAIQESTVLHLTHPATGEKLYADKKKEQAITITIASTSSREYREAVNAMHNRRLKREQRKEKITAEQQKEEGIELLTACCIDSDNLVYEGKPVKDEAAFRKLLSDDKFSWLKAQVDETLGSVELFIA
jgi:electron transfer flavoprotein alpha subunit